MVSLSGGRYGGAPLQWLGGSRWDGRTGGGRWALVGGVVDGVVDGEQWVGNGVLMIIYGGIV